jgi:hypothetical protein
MNDDLPIDSGLQSLEAQLSARRPKLPDREAQELLYQCAFAVGQKLAARRTRRWQIASAAMAVLLSGVGISLVNERVLMARREPSTMVPAASVQVQTPYNVPRPRSRVVAVPLDAWQVRADPAATFETALARFKQMDANSRSLSVGTMMRAAGTVQ